MGWLLVIFNICIAISYILLLRWILKGWKSTKTFEVNSDYVSWTPITVIVAARNEEGSIGKLLESLTNQNYPIELLQVIIVDDQSTDRTQQIIASYSRLPITLLKTENTSGGKKAAITLAMKSVKTQIVLCTDADCVPTQNWIRYMTAYYEEYKPKFLAGPIRYDVDDTVIQRFQYLDSIGNMAITANGIVNQKYYMANGANMLFESNLFEKVEGYDNDGVASGDDMMLIQKAACLYPSKIKFVKAKEAVVETQPEYNLTDLIIQRKRWASKSKHYTDRGILYVQLLVFVTVFVIVVDLLLIPFFGNVALYSFISMIGIKLITDYFFLKQLSSDFENTEPLISFLPASLWFMGYILWAGYSALFPTPYQWKGRNVN